MRSPLINALLSLSLLCVAGLANAASIAGSYSGRYFCGEWNTVDLQISDQGNGRISAIFKFPIRAGSGSGHGAYSMTGQYDERTGHFQLLPQRWIGRAPSGYQMIGLEGRFDPANRKLAGKPGNFMCGAFELVGAGGAPLSLLPAGSPVAPGVGGAPALATAPPALPGIEYWDATFDQTGARESEPIDDVIDWMRKENYYCVISRHVSWDSSGTRGTTSDKVDTRERYVIECNGNCRDLRYMINTQAQVYGYGKRLPVPVFQLKGLWFGGTVVNWVFMRPAGGTPPDIYVHQWSGSGFLNGPGCKAPKATND